MAIAIVAAGCASPTEKTADNYRFEVLDSQVRRGPDAQLRVRLVKLPEGQPVSGATVYEHRFDMFMSGYKISSWTMTEGSNPPPVIAVDEGNGVYRVHAQLPMAGAWTATLAARVPGETLPVRSTVRVSVN
ncbi:FixH family protein [Roseomonas chloroacetimidivorans]|uniref:FixH family protein n=1 Tax=Roseomonas chloroacetimidivorans TaxID=1766656 RepID=UPI003C727492